MDKETYDLIVLAGKGLIASGPAVKLLDILYQSVGATLKPWRIRREGEATAYVIEKTAESEAKAGIIKAHSEAEIQRELRRISDKRESRIVSNIEQTSFKSIKYLPPEVSNEPVDPDWATRFFGIVGDISSEALQEVWAKILAGEVAEPGTVSLRTMEVLRNVSQNEAEIFNRICALSGNSGALIHIGDDVEEAGYNFDEIILLQSAGLVSYSSLTTELINIRANQPEYPFTYTFNLNKGVILLLESTQKLRSTFPVHVLTTAGVELMKTIDKGPEQKEIDLLSLYFVKKGYSVKVFNVEDATYYLNSVQSIVN